MLRQMRFPIPRLLGYMSEQAIYMVNSFQFTRSARLVLAYRASASGSPVAQFFMQFRGRNAHQNTPGGLSYS